MYLQKSAIYDTLILKFYRSGCIMFDKIKKYLTEVCILFTLLIFLLYLVGTALIISTITINLASICVLFGLSLLLTLLNRILFIKKIGLALRMLIHYFSVLASSFVLFGVIGKVLSTSLATLFMLSIVTLVYSVFAVLIITLGSKNKNVKEEYTSMFNK